MDFWENFYKYRNTVPEKELELFDDLYINKIIDLIENNVTWKTFTDRLKKRIGKEDKSITYFRTKIPEENYDEFDSMTKEEQFVAASYDTWAQYEHMKKNITL